MPSVFTHAVAGAAIAQIVAPSPIRRTATWIGAALAVLPDADVIGFQFGIQYSDIFGHRGFTHSLAFACAASAIVVACWRAPVNRFQRFACLAVAAASHGILDAFTDGGLGVAFFAPFDSSRYFFPFRPIRVSPIDIPAFFSQRGVTVMASEFPWVWCPALAAILLAWAVRRFRGGRPSSLP